CTQNHLDRHKDLEEYFSAKAKIFANQTKDDFAVLNYDDPKMRGLADTLKSKVLFFNSPELKKAHPNDNLDFFAARCAVKALGISDEIVSDVFKDFKGVEHRLEWVRAINGIDFINDSKATTAEAGRWALERMTKPVIMICGGRDKHIDFCGLRDIVEKRVKHMFVIGESREKIKKAFEDVVAVEECISFSDVVKKSFKKAAKGDCVLLSPMCTSYDMFANFEERGREYKRLVNEL
ncbi:MAG: Mur ligase family protein, partial [Candidatus Omnitrophica bacterium]|nr:Mur ligase family protein [Candidatus Omnitrophota bacterium]